MFVHCRKSGEIFLSDTPDHREAVKLGEGTRAQLDQAVSQCARLSPDNKTWLVPGVPEARTSQDALVAVYDFLDRFHLILTSLL
ncbi:hypothetical protein K3727_09570 [Rhodobacteraceae bacterium M382]|nr:hypothetical protein K3727_09570 [Rhodobacteraceae bacterium M382]